MAELLRGICPYKDCERNLPFPSGTRKGQRGVCADCFRLFEVKTVNETTRKVTLSALE